MNYDKALSELTNLQLDISNDKKIDACKVPDMELISWAAVMVWREDYVYRMTAPQWITLIEQAKTLITFTQKHFVRDNAFHFPGIFKWIKIFRFAKKWTCDTVAIFAETK